MRTLGTKDAVAGMVACYDKDTFRRTDNVVDINAELFAKAKIAQKACDLDFAKVYFVKH